MKPILVYVAGPYSKPDPEANTNNAIDIGNQLLDLGYVPYVPHLSHFMELRKSRPYQAWLDFDMHWLRVCHAVLRMPGESSGADKEVAEAARLGIPVFYSIEGLYRSGLHCAA